MGSLRATVLCLVIAACGGGGAADTGAAQPQQASAAAESVAGSQAGAAAGIGGAGPDRAAAPAASGGVGGAAAAASGGVSGASAAANGGVGQAPAANGGMPATTTTVGASAGSGSAAGAGGVSAASTGNAAGSSGASAGTGGSSTGRSFSDSFDGDGPLMGYTTNNASAIPDVARANGRYTAKLESNANDITLHYNQSQGRIDARQLSFPFEVIARNIGIGTPSDPQMPAAGGGVRFNLAGIQVHVLDFESRNSAHIVVGHSGTANFSIEGKSTVNGTSVWDNEGSNANPLGRADLRIVGDADRTITVFWQAPNADPAAQKDAWKPYKGTGKLSGPAPSFGQEVYVGLITYAVGETGVPFVGTCDSFEGREQ